MKEGSITVEAAILVPVMILILLPFLFLIRRLSFSVLFENDVQDALMRLSTVSYVLEKADKASEGSGKSRDRQRKAVEGAEEKKETYEALESSLSGMLGIGTGGQGGEGSLGEALEDVLLEEAGRVYLWACLTEAWDSDTLSAWGVEGGWAGISMDGCNFFYSDDSRGYLMKAQIDIRWRSPIAFWRPPDSQVCRVSHAFFGEKHSSSSSSSSKEEDEEEEIVYRIGNGSKYHLLSCFLIAKTKSSLTQEEALSRGLSPCLICGGGDLVSYVSSGGDCYHSENCRLLFPDLSGMSVEEAVMEGLTPCGLCYGGAYVYFH